MPSSFFNLGEPGALPWLWLLVPLAVLFVLDLRRRNRVLRLFVERSLLDDVAPRRSVVRPVVKFALWSAGMAVLIVALARPRWDPRQIELEQSGQNILFCVDVSNSMRARDVDPSRLEAAKSAIRSLVENLPAGHQVGLMAYAGEAELKCPLTPNYRHLLTVLDRVTYNSASVGGTNLGDAIDKAKREVFGLDAGVTPATRPADGTPIQAEQPDGERNANVLIILTDGESHEGDAREMARQAHALGVGIYIIGLGTTEGAPIPIEEDGKIVNLKYKGEEVITRFDDASLRVVIEGLQGRCGYLPAGKSNVDLVDVFEKVISQQTAAKKKLSFTVWDEKFQLFVGTGLVLIVVASLISDQRPAAKREDSK
ncbi:MAG TPA: VWA domain-containing protein [Phycisphaerae bacterium]|nr:VWA domain-containing protein [Phycisphaerae bacterium]HOL25174.1 VWA domain-containing protein [Phycisphaerae bacterium]